jgi:hypothetical protein
LSTKKNAYAKAVLKLKPGTGIQVNRREYMRTNSIGSVKEIKNFIKKEYNNSNVLFNVEQVGREMLIYKKTTSK